MVLLFSLIGFYMVFGKIQDQSELTKKLEATQEQISGLTDIIKENNKQISTLQQQVAESVKNQAVINAKYEALRASVNKPLRQPQQDLLFD